VQAFQQGQARGAALGTNTLQDYAGAIGDQVADTFDSSRSNSFGESLDMVRANRKAVAEAHPTAAVAGEVAGGLQSALATGGGVSNLAAKALPQAAEALTAYAGKGLAQRAAVATGVLLAEGVTQGETMNAAHELDRAAENGDFKGVGERIFAAAPNAALEGAKSNLLWGGALKTGVLGVSKVANAVRRARTGIPAPASVNEALDGVIDQFNDRAKAIDNEISTLQSRLGDPNVTADEVSAVQDQISSLQTERSALDSAARDVQARAQDGSATLEQLALKTANKAQPPPVGTIEAAMHDPVRPLRARDLEDAGDDVARAARANVDKDTVAAVKAAALDENEALLQEAFEIEAGMDHGLRLAQKNVWAKELQEPWRGPSFDEMLNQAGLTDGMLADLEKRTQGEGASKVARLRDKIALYRSELAPPSSPKKGPILRAPMPGQRLGISSPAVEIADGPAHSDNGVAFDYGKSYYDKLEEGNDFLKQEGIDAGEDSYWAKRVEYKPIDDLVSPRAAEGTLDAQRVARYADEMRKGVKADVDAPVTLGDKRPDGKFPVEDGNHRITAAREAGRKFVPVEVETRVPVDQDVSVRGTAPQPETRRRQQVISSARRHGAPVALGDNPYQNISELGGLQKSIAKATEVTPGTPVHAVTLGNMAVALDQVKRDADKLAVSRGGLIHERLLNPTEALKQTLEDQTTFGKFAEAQAAVNPVWTYDIDTSNSPLIKNMIKEGNVKANRFGGDRYDVADVIDRKALAAHMDRVGVPEGTEDQVEEAFKRRLRARELSYTERMAWAEQNPELAQKLNRYTEIRKQVEDNINKVALANRALAVRNVEPGLARQIVESVPVIGPVTKKVADRAAAWATDRAQDASGAAFGIKAQAAKVQERLGKAAKKLPILNKAQGETLERAVRSTATKQAVQKALDAAERVQDPESEDYGKMQSSLQRLESALGPDMANTYAEQAQKRAQFLLEKAGPAPAPSVFGGQPKRVLDDETVDRMGRYIDAADDPVAALERIGAGEGDQEDHETLEALYPGMLQDFKAKAVSRLAESKSELPYDTQLAIAQALRIPLTDEQQPDNQAFWQNFSRSQAQAGAEQAMRKRAPKLGGDGKQSRADRLG
jgi:hypothetical protein